MKARLPLMVQDPALAGTTIPRIVEGFDADRERFFLDGPVVRRLALLDFDPQTGRPTPGVPFRPPKRGRKLGRYSLRDEDDLQAPDFISVSCFATVLKTLYMFEEEDALGREVTWGFKTPQLLVVPRAGEWENAFYERASRSLQFFHFGSDDATVYTALSRDVVAHESGHAILDGIAPDLYDAITPESLAIHEAVADIAALLMAFRSATLRKEVLASTDGSIQDPTAFGSIAEEFGTALGDDSLRDLHNERNLIEGDPACVTEEEPHDLSEVLSGALFRVMLDEHEGLWGEYEGGGMERLAASGKALAVGMERFKRLVIRGLDYLPPGDCTFLDLGRAIVAADAASHPEASAPRERLAAEFERRGIASSGELQPDPDLQGLSLGHLSLDTLLESDWAAYVFAEEHRELLGIPKGGSFHVLPRLDVTKTRYHRSGTERVRELIFKVSWLLPEPSDLGAEWPETRVLRVGTTMAVNWETRRVTAVLTGSQAEGEHVARSHRDKQRDARTAWLLHLARTGTLQPAAASRRSGGRALRGVIEAQGLNGLMRVHGSAKALHIARGL